MEGFMYVFLLKIMEFTQHSTGLLLGNLVDGLPGALHTKAVWGVQGIFGPAPIDGNKHKMFEKAKNQFSKCFNQVQECICMRFMAEVIFKDYQETDDL